MRKRNLLLILFSVLLLFSTACSLNNDVSKTPKATTAGSIINPANGNSPSQNDYQIIDAYYNDRNIKVKYPQIIGLDDTNKQNKINDLIKNEMLKQVKQLSDEGVALDINYEIKLKGDTLLSIVYSGYRYMQGSAYPNNTFFTTNIYIPETSALRLSQAVNINNSFVNKLLAAKYLPWNSDLASATEYVKGEIKRYDLIKNLKYADYIGAENQANAYSYFTKDSIGISLAVPHAIGDHAEFEIKYSDIKDNIKTENQIWKSLLK